MQLPWWIGDGLNAALVEFRGEYDETMKLVNLQRLGSGGEVEWSENRKWQN